MTPEKEPSPFPLGYIYPRWDVDSTTNKSAMKFPTSDSPTTKTVEAPHVEPPTFFPTQPPLPPPQPIPEKEQDYLSDIVCVLLLIGVPNLCISGYERSKRHGDISIRSLRPRNLYHIQLQITTRGEITFNVKKPPDCSVPMYGDILVSIIYYNEKPLSMAIMEPFPRRK
ncbi:hypothetical protein RHGRI_021100 [Rhododendron griersonianum]|uniref:Uncharacterized protein n=1 Tax=Rhododendron griersonianum TaxID=479676 RepID=A0AAV6JM76_9ERIC|nr:hypothetical protein RHGRI_021100 [Rhododendron griersonianum]